MKVGLRKPSLKKSIKARTTGKAKRKLKRMVNPFYGKKGMGFIKNPGQAIKGKIYRKTTFSAKKAAKTTGGCLWACFAIPFYLMWYMLVFVWYMMKYITIGSVWLCVAIVNACIALVEWIININRDSQPEDHSSGAVVSDDPEATDVSDFVSE